MFGRIFLSLATVTALLAVSSRQVAAVDELHAGPFHFIFATAEEAHELLSTEDSFTDSMSPFDRQVRMRTPTDRGTQAFLEFAAGEARDWSPPARDAVAAAIREIEPSLRRITNPIVDTVLLIHTSGKEEGGAAYTRGSGIILPEGQTGSVHKPRPKLIAHELFHVLSRNDRELRDRLYAEIGFRFVGAIDLPPSLADLKITNPDAPKVEHVMEVMLREKETITIAPILFAKRPYQTEGPANLFGYLEFRLLEVIPIVGKRYVAKLDDGEVVVHPPSVPDFRRQVGRNTNYILHPDEILADNFALLMTGQTDQPDRWLIDAVAEAFFGPTRPEPADGR